MISVAAPPISLRCVPESRSVERGLEVTEWSALTVDRLRVLLRGLQLWRAALEDLGIDTVVDEDGNEWVIWDIEAIFRASRHCLTRRQSQAIEFFLVGGMREQDVAERMGIRPTNPIGMYATDGLRTLVPGLQNGSITLGGF